VSEIEIQKSAESAVRHQTEFLAVPVSDIDAPSKELRALDAATGGRLLSEARRWRRYPGRVGSVFIYQTHGEQSAELIALIGMGTPDAEGFFGLSAWRDFAGRARNAAAGARAKLMAVSVGSALASERVRAAVGGVVEGLLLSAYEINGYRSEPQDKGPTRCVVVGSPMSKAAVAAEERGHILAEATCAARDWINLPAAVLNPAEFATIARRVARKSGLRIKVHGPEELEKLGMGAILGVGRGSRNEERLIEVIYRPTGMRGSGASEGHIALVGKGITFDSGGLSLKPARGMEIQKRDMAGGAAVLGAMQAIGRLRPNVEVRGLIAAAENMPGGNALRPGDVLKSYTGKTIEVLNTDAEGRLVLADALGYAAAGCGSGTAPRFMVDVATLTGAATIALGRGIGAVMGSDTDLVERLIHEAGRSGEPLWELPLLDEYRSGLKSSVADIKNTGDGTAGSIFGGLFLKAFVGNVRWAHMDIAAVAFAEKAKPCVPRGAVGWGVGTLVGFVEQAARRGARR
jgi:leucyl aminopeptidase